jgi:hypothetical protein
VVQNRQGLLASHEQCGYTMVAEVGSILLPPAAKRASRSRFVKPYFTAELTSLATHTKTFQHLQSLGKSSLVPLTLIRKSSLYYTQGC